MIDRVKLWKIVLMSWMFTLMSLFNIVVVTLMIGFFAIRFIGPRPVILMVMATLALVIFTFLIGEVIVNRVFQAERPDPVRDKVFIDAVDTMKKNTHMWIKPRAYILQVGSPNAMAYGPGLPGLCAVGISRELIDLLSPKELEAVLGHEFAHIRSRDIGILTVVGLLQSLIEKFSKQLTDTRSVWMRSFFVYAIAWVLLHVAKGMFAISRFAISQERELAADALGASYCGSSESLIHALEKLHSVHKNEKVSSKEETPFADLMISHPGLEERIASLRAITVVQPQGGLI